MRVWKGPYSARICSVESQAIQKVSLYAIPYLVWLKPNPGDCDFHGEIQFPSSRAASSLICQDLCLRDTGRLRSQLQNFAAFYPRFGGWSGVIRPWLLGIRKFCQVT